MTAMNDSAPAPDPAAPASVERWYEGGERYAFDTGRCRTARDWCQLDLRDDCAFVGTWVQPHTRELLSFREGDVSLETWHDDTAFAAGLRAAAAYYREQESWLGIDPGLGARAARHRARLADLGVADLLHPDNAATAA